MSLSLSTRIIIGIITIIAISIFYGYADAKWGYAGRKDRPKKDNYKIFKKMESDEKKYRRSWFWFYFWAIVFFYLLYLQSFLGMTIFGVMYYMASIEYNLDRPIRKRRKKKLEKRGLKEKFESDERYDYNCEHSDFPKVT